MYSSRPIDTGDAKRVLKMFLKLVDIATALNCLIFLQILLTTNELTALGNY